MNSKKKEICRTIDSLALGYGKGRLTCFLGDPEAIYDVIPADMVVNAMIATITAHANQTFSETIYHVGSSVSNPLKFTTIQRCGYLYDDMNTEKLRRAVKGSGEEDNMFYFDPTIIDWDEYFQHIHLPGVVNREFK
ncbi:Fatty acyl-CoA reductase [Cynara cardunculus var. scolymus]|uniref:Fatty acyl-CoA reductase n=1 Tax=Cynara cardunculus var. scolymus TaxID=59895 RepID=A0A103XH99_CYNCS|nr:Fatty acyl-CoA reductase [Cynara cardunculus var. scolymus]